MKKRDIKKRKKEKKTTSNFSTNNKNIKGRIRAKKKLGTTTKLALFFAVIAILLICYMALGMKKTILVGMFLFLIGMIYYIFSIKGKRRKRFLNVILIIVLLLGIAGLTAFSAFIVYVKGKADPKYDISLLNTREISHIYASNGIEIAKLGSEKREKVTYDELPEVLVDAIIATEDSRFFQHNGLDAPRFIKATIGQVTQGSGAGGASTLSMQVVKNSFTDREQQLSHGIPGIIRKFEDIYLAVFRLEKDYSKEQIIEFYVNNHFLGGNIYGVEEASNAYFGKSVTDLNLSEAAILAGMFKSPNYYRPTANPKNATARRKTVLYLMRRAGYITKEEEEMANAIPVESLTNGAGTINESPYQGFIDTVAQELEDKYGVDPYTTPLQVYTTLNIERQEAVNSVLSGQNYDWIDDRVQSGIAVVDSETGAILAIGNGRNINGRSYSTKRILNYATQINRQPGSTAKPLFDYGPGIEYLNWSTYQQFVDEPYTYTGGRSIKNSDGTYMGQISLRTALSRSRNIPALKAFQSIDNNKIKEFVTNLGITPEICNSGYRYDKDTNKCINKKDESDIRDTIYLHEAHSIGAFTGVSPLEMAGAYAAFSNGGYYNEPYSVAKFEYRATGEVIEHQSNKKQVMSDATAYMIASVLQDVKSLTGYNPANVAKKTGTTTFEDKTMEDYNMPWDATRDAWIVGFSTKTVLSVWYGYDDFDYDSIAQGYVLHDVPAARQKDALFNALVDAGAMEQNRTPFTQPSSVVRVSVAAGSNPPKLAAPGMPAVSELFKKGTEPTEYDLSNYKIQAPSNLKANVTNGKLTLTWDAVSPGELGDDSHGKYGYNVYKDNVLITWTDKTSYTTSSNIYGKYKIIGTYKSYNDLQTEAATIEVKEAKPEPETPKEEEEEDPIVP